MHVAVDANVPYVADKKHGVSLDCYIACVNLLLDIMAGQHTLVLDRGREVLTEYLTLARTSTGEPDLGTQFAIWAESNMYYPDKCELVDIAHTNDSFAEIPSDLTVMLNTAQRGQTKFDLSDRKFVALTFAHPARPSIHNAVDTDWLYYADVLAQHGVKVVFLCPEDCKADNAYMKKHRGRETSAKRRKVKGSLLGVPIPHCALQPLQAGNLAAHLLDMAD